MHFRAKLALFLCTATIGSQSACFAGAAPPTLKQLSPILDSTKPSATAQSGSAPHVIKLQTSITQEYILGPGDVLSLTDTSEDKPSTTLAPILPDGTAVTNFTGVIPAAGRSIREINETVNEMAKKWYVNPSIIVNLAKQRPTQVYLLGELVHPGLYSVGAGGGAEMRSASQDNEGDSGTGGGDVGSGPSPSSLAGLAGGITNLTLSGAIQMAGGLKDTADVRHLRVTRLAPKETFPVDLWKLMIDGDVSEDISLQPGDVIYVPKGGADYNPQDFGMLVNNKPKVRVLGAVKSPGLIAMQPDDDIFSAVAKAGGFENTAVTRFVILARTGRDGTVTTEKINFGKKGIQDGHSEARGKIHPGDLIIVKKSPGKVVGMTFGRNLPNLVTSAFLSILITGMNRP